MQLITKDLETVLRMASIPQTVSDSMFETNRDKADSKNVEHCPCCGKALTGKPKYYINTAWGGSMYIPVDETDYNDTWIMQVGNTCAKSINPDYLFKNEY